MVLFGHLSTFNWGKVKQLSFSFFLDWSEMCVQGILRKWICIVAYFDIMPQWNFKCNIDLVFCVFPFFDCCENFAVLHSQPRFLSTAYRLPMWSVICDLIGTYWECHEQTMVLILHSNILCLLTYFNMYVMAKILVAFCIVQIWFLGWWEDIFNWKWHDLSPVLNGVFWICSEFRWVFYYSCCHCNVMKHTFIK